MQLKVKVFQKDKESDINHIDVHDSIDGSKNDIYNSN